MGVIGGGMDACVDVGRSGSPRQRDASDRVRGAGDFDTTTVQKERDHPEKIRGLCLVSSSKLNNTHCMVKTFYRLHVYISSSFRPFFNSFFKVCLTS